VNKSEAESKAIDLLKRFDLDNKATAFPDRLSGGQQQRVAVLRAIATNPRILLLDEVTSALDPVLVAEVLSLIAELKTEGMTMVVATHEMGFAKRVADQVGYLCDGVLLELGQPEQIIDSPQTSQLQTFLKSVREAGRL
jgi:polar amino acid transport system ATP-binding protein